MAYRDIEVEIKVKVEHTESLRRLLTQKATHSATSHQIDTYFSPPHRDFLVARPAKEWLRLREDGDGYSFTYKNWHYATNGKSNYCDEFEVSVDDAVRLRKILDALNMRPLCTVDKTRNSWHYQEYEISIDMVVGLGEFVEIEYIGTDEIDPEVATENMIDLLRGTDCGTLSRNQQGYPFLLLFPEEAQYEQLR